MTVDVRRILTDELAKVTPGPVAVTLSGGVDSTSVLLALLDLGRDVTAYSFLLDGVASSDFACARANAGRFGVPFVPVFLPRGTDVLAADVVRLIRTIGLRKKTAVECTWPYLYVLDAVTQPNLATGACADGHFGVSKKAMMHHRHTVAALDAYRAKLFADPDYAQTTTVTRLAAARGVAVATPYRCPAMVDAFRGRSWDEVNRPHQKQPIWDAFKAEFARARLLPAHTNLQLGDSGIAAHFERLLGGPLNRAGSKSVVGMYNAIARGDVG